MTTAAEFSAQASETFAKLEALVPELENARTTDTARYDALKAKVDELGNDVATAKANEAAAKQAEEFEAMKARIADIGAELRKPSKAALISGGNDPEVGIEGFLTALAVAQNPKAPTEYRQKAEKALLDMGSTWQGVPEYSKATLGETNANGGYIAPRPFVAEFTTVGVANNPYRSLLNVVTGINTPSIEVPHIGLAPARALVIARGSTKTNVGVDSAVYTATFYTLAQIHDAANQWLRNTAGKGEALIRLRLGKAMALGEAYYILNGSGTSEPKGILTSIGTSGTFVTSHTASNSTIAGNGATAIAKASKDLANRARTPDGVVMNAGDFWTFMAQGADAAGFYVAPMGGAASVNAIGSFDNGSPAMRIWGLPVYADPNMPADSLVVGAWKEAELYLGDGYRVDTSTEAGTRWDQNLTGFRAEEEIAFNADPYVAAGMFQRITDAVA